MATKSIKSTSSNDNIIPEVSLDTGILRINRGEATDLPPLGGELVISVHSTIVDRLEGTSHTESVWSPKTNLQVLTAAAVSNVVRERCATFFMTREIIPLLVKLIDVRTVRVGEVMIIKPELYKAIDASVGNSDVSNILMELLVPYLTKVGILSDGGDYSRRVYYPFTPVTTDTITQDVSMFEIVRVMEDIKPVDIKDRKYSKEAFAESIGDALFDIGRKFKDVNSIGSIVGDIVRGVRAYIDPNHIMLTGEVDASWRDNDVVATLATNWVFLTAALDMPSGSTITPTNDGWKLDKYAPGILAAIKSSTRYAIVGKVEVLRHMGSKVIRDTKGIPRSVVLWRSANPDAVGMAAYAYQDSALKGAFTLTSPRERIGEVIASAYNDPKALGTDAAAKMLCSVLTHAVEAGYEDAALLYQIDLGAYAHIPNQVVIAMVAERIVVAFDEDGNALRDESGKAIPSPTTGSAQFPMKMWFTVKTIEKDLSWWLTGRFDGNSYVTSAVAEAFLVMGDLTPTSPMDAKPQLYTAQAFNTRIIDFNVGSLASLNTRFSFNVEVYGTAIQGSIRPGDLGTMKTNSETSLVVPTYNDAVFHAVASTFDTMLAIAQSLVAAAGNPGAHPNYVGGTALAAFIERGVARNVLAYAKVLSPAFRAEIHRGMIGRSTSGMSMAESMRMRAMLAQKAFGAYADVFALSLFINMQGMGTQDSFWASILTDATMAQTYFEVETDRPAIS